MLSLDYLVALSPEIRTRLEPLGSDVACMSHIVRGAASNCEFLMCWGNDGLRYI